MTRIPRADRVPDFRVHPYFRLVYKLLRDLLDRSSDSIRTSPNSIVFHLALDSCLPKLDVAFVLDASEKDENIYRVRDKTVIIKKESRDQIFFNLSLVPGLLIEPQ